MRSPFILASRILGRTPPPAYVHSRRRKARPILELLERREVLSTFTWTGGGNDGNWDNSANWQGGAPTAGNADIVFPSTASPVTITLPTQHDQLLVTSITVQGGTYTLEGTSTASFQTLNLADGATIATPTSGSTLAIPPGFTTFKFLGAVTKTGPGTLALNNDVYFFPTSPPPAASQSLHVSQGGTVALGGAATLGGFSVQIDTGAKVIVADGHTPSLGSLSGGGTLQVGTNSDPSTTGIILLTPQGVTDHFNGVINGSGGLIQMLGSGSLSVGAINPAGSGTFDLKVVGGAMSLGGASFLQKLDILAPSTERATFGGSSTINVSGTASFSNLSTFAVTLDGTGAGQFTKLVNGNSVELGGSTLSVNLGYAPTAGDTFTIISSPGINGQFAGLADGQTFTTSTGVPFRFNQSTTAVTLTALATATSTTLSGNTPNPSVAGDQVTFTATVKRFTAGSPVTTGTVTFYADNSPLGPASSLDGTGTATFSTSSLAVGNHAITAVYNDPAGNFLGSTSSAVTQTVLQSAVSTTTSMVSNSPSQSVVGQSVTLVAAVQGSGTAVTQGTVTFLANHTPIGTVNLDGAGRATFASSGLAAGTYSITAQYNGAPAFNPSASAAVTQTVVTPPTIIGFKPVFTQKRNRKGKPVGKPVFGGFEFDFSTAMDTGALSNPANYTMGAFVTKRQGRKNVTVLQPTGFSVSVIGASGVVLKPAGRQTFAKGGQITLNAGLVSSQQAHLVSRTFNISRGGKGLS